MSVKTQGFRWSNGKFELMSSVSKAASFGEYGYEMLLPILDSINYRTYGTVASVIRQSLRSEFRMDKDDILPDLMAENIVDQMTREIIVGDNNSSVWVQG